MVLTIFGRVRVERLCELVVSALPRGRHLVCRVQGLMGRGIVEQDWYAWARMRLEERGDASAFPKDDGGRNIETWAE